MPLRSSHIWHILLRFCNVSQPFPPRFSPFDASSSTSFRSRLSVFLRCPFSLRFSLPSVHGVNTKRSLPLFAFTAFGGVLLTDYEALRGKFIIWGCVENGCLKQCVLAAEKGLWLPWIEQCGLQITADAAPAQTDRKQMFHFSFPFLCFKQNPSDLTMTKHLSHINGIIMDSQKVIILVRAN